MRALYFFASFYILIAAVACQPLREAKAELEVSRKAYRQPRQPPKPPRAASPKAKRVSVSLALSQPDQHLHLLNTFLLP